MYQLILYVIVSLGGSTIGITQETQDLQYESREMCYTLAQYRAEAHLKQLQINSRGRNVTYTVTAACEQVRK